MGVTATQLAYRALRDLGCLRPGQTTSTDVLNDVLTALNERIDSDLLNPGMVFAFRADIYTLQNAQQFYLIGPGATPQVINGVSYGAFNAPRPTEIYDANILLTTVNPIVRQPLHLANVDEWAAVRVRNIQFAIPLELYYDKNFDPVGQFATLNLWPGPQTAYQLELFTWQQLQQFPDLVTALNWPPGYVLYLRKNLAVDIAPEMEIYSKLAKLAHPRQDKFELVKQQAKDAKDAIENYNAPSPLIGVDAALRDGGSGGAWNYAIGMTISRG